MANKKQSSAKSTAPKKPLGHASKASSFTARVVHATTCVLALSLAISTAKQVLTPLFGSVATNLVLHKAVLSSTLALALFRPRSSPTALGVVLTIAPAAFYQIGRLTSRRKDPFFGPIISYLPVLVPAILLTVGVVRDTLPRSLTHSPFGHSVSVFSGICVALAVTKTQTIWPNDLLLGAISRPLLLVIFAWLVIATGEPIRRLTVDAKPQTLSKKLLRFLTLTPVLATTFVSLYSPPTHALSFPYTVFNSTEPNLPTLRILSSTQSTTGRIVVGENYEHGFRYLRADHSLLGGVWIGKKVHSMDTSKDAWIARDVNGDKLGDSIYSAFVLQEAVRLIEKESKPENALIIGLGAGISGSAFSRHGLNTTVVEIDPAVYTAARDWFGFGLADETVPRGGVFLEDARGWVQQRAAEQSNEVDESEKFDIVVHDCFSGGGVPEQLFSTEFWKMLEKIVKKDGVVAVNFAGHISSNPAKAILATLQRSFAQCRVFHDYFLDFPQEKLPEEFINIVYFCTPSSSPALTFRPSKLSDYLNSYLREYILRDFDKREVPLDLIRGNLTQGSSEELALGLVLTDDNNRLGKWEDKAAVEHWGLMRTVLSDIYWETY